MMSSLRAIWTYRANSNRIISPYERPPYPILVDVPTASQLAGEWRACDFFAVGVFYAFGTGLAFWASRPFPMMYQRTLIYHILSHAALVTGGTVFLGMIPYQRLTGFYDNGLRWKKPENKLRKFDNTSEFEKATFWGRMVHKNRDD
jgi:hypothetical protein